MDFNGVKRPEYTYENEFSKAVSSYRAKSFEESDIVMDDVQREAQLRYAHIWNSLGLKSGAAYNHHFNQNGMDWVQRADVISQTYDNYHSTDSAWVASRGRRLPEYSQVFVQALADQEKLVLHSTEAKKWQDLRERTMTRLAWRNWSGSQRDVQLSVMEMFPGLRSSSVVENTFRNLSTGIELLKIYQYPELLKAARAKSTLSDEDWEQGIKWCLGMALKFRDFCKTLNIRRFVRLECFNVDRVEGENIDLLWDAFCNTATRFQDGHLFLAFACWFQHEVTLSPTLLVIDFDPPVVLQPWHSKNGIHTPFNKYWDLFSRADVKEIRSSDYSNNCLASVHPSHCLRD